MKVLYIGGVYPLEYSLFQESEVNPNLQVLICNNGASAPDLFNHCRCSLIKDREDINNLKNQFKPDLTIFRDWCGANSFRADYEFIWSQEIWPKLTDASMDFDIKCVNRDNSMVLYQSKVRSKKFGGHWLPYCVTDWKLNVVRDIPIMLATSLPIEPSSLNNKTISLDILVKPFYNDGNLFVFNGYGGGIDKISYLRQRIRPPFSVIDAPKNIARAKIYLSPTAIFYDEGCVSYKTPEAMSLGCLVVTNNYVGMEDMFGPDGENLIYANTPEEAKDKVTFYLNNEKLREEVANRGKKFVLSEYSWEKHLNRLYKEIFG